MEIKRKTFHESEDFSSTNRISFLLTFDFDLQTFFENYFQIKKVESRSIFSNFPRIDIDVANSVIGKFNLKLNCKV